MKGESKVKKTAWLVASAVLLALVVCLGLAMMHINSLADDNAALATKLNQAETRLTATQRKLDDTLSDYAVSQANYDAYVLTSEDALQATAAQAAALQADVLTQDQQLLDAYARMDELQAQVDMLTANLAEAQSALTAAQTALSEKEAAIATLNTELEAAKALEAVVNEKQTLIDQLNGALETLQAEWAAKAGEWETLKENLATELNELKTTLTDKDALQAALEQAKQDVEALLTDVKGQLQDAKDALTAALFPPATEPRVAMVEMISDAGEVLYRITLNLLDGEEAAYTSMALVNGAFHPAIKLSGAALQSENLVIMPATAAEYQELQELIQQGVDQGVFAWTVKDKVLETAGYTVKYHVLDRQTSYQAEVCIYLYVANAAGNSAFVCAEYLGDAASAVNADSVQAFATQLLSRLTIQ